VLDAHTAAALNVRPEEAVATYTVQASDLAKVKPAPKDWLAKSRAQYLGYESLAAAVAEKFHCSQALLAELNPSVSLSGLKVGDRLTVPAVTDWPAGDAADRLVIRFSEKTIRLYAGQRQVGLLHCSIAADKAKRPSGAARVATIVENPYYSFDPAHWPEVKGVSQKLSIPPGPRNPVGLCWIGLSLSGYGIHGTPSPEMIGKTGSHGCFRLANWDAVRLGRRVQVGAAVQFAD
jgi:lipoprotein-anchoring transpeptidase ErfK/SrfK